MPAPNDHHPRDSTAPTGSADSLVRRLGARYLVVLAAVAGLMVVDQAIIQPLLIRMDSYAPVINLAGRQRMLSQKVAKSALAVQIADEPSRREANRRELETALAEWTAAHDALRHGSERLNIPRIESPALAKEWFQLEADFTAIAAAAKQIVSHDEPAAHSIAVIVAHEPSFLMKMDRIVGLVEQEAAQEIRRLRTYGLAIAAVVITLLVGLGWFVVRPATRAIRRQVDELEVRVSQRTRALADAVVSLQHEVAEREQAEARGQRLAAQLAHADRIASMGHLTVGLAHELNQPLGAIANYAAASDVVLAGSPALDESQRLRGYLDHISRAALRAGEIVRRIRRFIERDTTAVSDVDLSDLVREIVELCQYEIRGANVETNLELGDQRVHVSVDPIQIQQVLVNLVQNALQSMRACSLGARRLTIRLGVNDESAQLDVIDSGPGFDDPDLDAPFAPFQTTKQEGLGVGLSICRTIVEAHGGSIWITPAVAGAHLSFALPLAILHAPRRSLQSDVICR